MIILASDRPSVEPSLLNLEDPIDSPPTNRSAPCWTSILQSRYVLSSRSSSPGLRLSPALRPMPNATGDTSLGTGRGSLGMVEPSRWGRP